MSIPDLVTGQLLHYPFPPTIERLLAEGPAFLTNAFRISGALSDDNRVTAITSSREFVGGGAGRKLALSVRYQMPSAHLHTDLFVKYPRDPGDPLRDLFSHLMEPETRFALLSRRNNFPVAVPKCYFADYDPVTRSGILITERIGFGRGDIEPFQDKCLDYELQNPTDHYRALIRAIAKLAGKHRSGDLGPDVDRQFPFDPTLVREHDRIPYSLTDLQAKITAIGTFAQRYPNLLSPQFASPQFLKRLSIEAPRFLAREVAIKQCLNSHRDFIALCHWNANVDNAWFWRDTQGILEAGLLDWGSVGQMSVAQAIFGVLCATETKLWNTQRDSLLDEFIAEYAYHGGPRLVSAQLRQHVQLFTALLGLAWMIDAPAIIEAQLPTLRATTDRFEPAFRSNFLARAQLQLLIVFLNAWATEDFATVLDNFLKSPAPQCTDWS